MHGFPHRRISQVHSRSCKPRSICFHNKWCIIPRVNCHSPRISQLVKHDDMPYCKFHCSRCKGALCRDAFLHLCLAQGEFSKSISTRANIWKPYANLALAPMIHTPVQVAQLYSECSCPGLDMSQQPALNGYLSILRLHVTPYLVHGPPDL